MLVVTAESIEGFRQQKAAECEAIIKADSAFYDQKTPHVDVSEPIAFKTRDGADLKFYFIKPKALDMSQKHPAYVYAHGGGGIIGSPEESNPVLCATALNLNCVVFNVDYRLGPDVKCPKGMEDFIDGLKAIIADADKYSMDASRVCIAGISGGGWICAGAANILAKADEAKIVKAVFIHTGMLSDETAHIPDEELEKPCEYWMKPYLTSAYKLHSTDYEAQ